MARGGDPARQQPNSEIPGRNMSRSADDSRSVGAQIRLPSLNIPKKE
jgi:hypothetical protein